MPEFSVCARHVHWRARRRIVERAAGLFSITGRSSKRGDDSLVVVTFQILSLVPFRLRLCTRQLWGGDAGERRHVGDSARALDILRFAGVQKRLDRLPIQRERDDRHERTVSVRPKDNEPIAHWLPLTDAPVAGTGLASGSERARTWLHRSQRTLQTSDSMSSRQESACPRRLGGRLSVVVRPQPPSSLSRPPIESGPRSN